MEKEKELKTLNDIGQDHPYEMFCDLKEAAREWIKELDKDRIKVIKRLKREEKQFDEEFDEDESIDTLNTARVQLYYIKQGAWFKEENAKIEWIKHFFNLGEDDE